MRRTKSDNAAESVLAYTEYRARLNSLIQNIRGDAISTTISGQTDSQTHRHDTMQKIPAPALRVIPGVRKNIYNVM